MILDSIRLDNFGAYGGLQEAVLTPAADKAVVLFGGMNGGGKTTLLDALQLVLYGSKAKVSNRGRMAYRDYLAECIHRGADPGEGAGITLHFRRMIEGETRHFEVERSWRQGVKGIEESVRVLRDGLPDETFTAHWDEVIEAYLPVSISNLFFFDGEQIKELAEGQNAARIIGTAIHLLLGLDLVDRLENDLRVFERRKKSETLDSQALMRLKQAEEELDHLLAEEAKTLQEEGRLTNKAGQLAEKVNEARKTFESEGGNLFLRHDEIAEELKTRQDEKQVFQDELRSLAAGALPLLLIQGQLDEIQKLAHHETSVRHNRLLVEALEERDEAIISILGHESLSAAALKRVAKELERDRKWRLKEAGEDLILDADPGFETQLMHLRENTLPAVRQRTIELLKQISLLDERITRLEADLARVPDQDRIAIAQETLRHYQLTA